MSCASCQNPKAPLTCGVCESPVCKDCAEFAGEDRVAYLEKIPAHYAVGAFCRECFETKIAPEIADYEEILEKAKQVDVFFKSQGKESRFIRRTERPIRVQNCADKDDAVMKLAFLAASKGFNILIDVDIQFSKLRSGGGYQSSRCDGTAIPGIIDPEKLKRRFVGNPN